MKAIKLLRQNLVLPKGSRISKKILSDLVKDVRCEIEHGMLGGTTIKTVNPRIPYAILAGMSIREVNKKRMIIYRQEVIQTYFGLRPEDFGEKTIVARFAIEKVSIRTGEIPEPKLVEILGYDRVSINAFLWKNKEEYIYVGPYFELFLKEKEKR